MRVLIVLFIILTAMLDILAPQVLETASLKQTEKLIAVEASLDLTFIHCPLHSNSSNSKDGHQQHGPCASHCHFGHCGFVSSQAPDVPFETETAWTSWYQFFVASPELSGLRRPPKSTV